MCVCFRPIGFVIFVHLLDALHISLALHLSVMMALSDVSAGVSREGRKTRGLFPSICVSFLPHLPPAVLGFLFIARRVRPPLSLVISDVDVCECTDFG